MKSKVRRVAPKKITRRSARRPERKAAKGDRSAPLLLYNIHQLLTLRSAASGPRRERALSELAIIEGGAVVCASGKIVSVGTTRDAWLDPWLKRNRKHIREIDCRGKVVLPGFVDSHTHPVFTEPRLVDFEKRIAGASYEEIAAAGGGIRSSVEGVRKATKATLTQRVLSAFREMTAQGTTTVEAKSGYGLTTEAELKSLGAIREAAKQWPGTVVATLLGAHSVPREYLDRSQKYVEIVCKEMIPLVARQKLATFVDVFCDRGAFSVEDAEQVFRAATEHGLQVRAHVCQLTSCDLSSLLALGPASFDHMDYVSEQDISELSRSSTIATLVPGANYFLGTGRYPPARKLIDSGVAVSLATDFNPGTSPTTSMPFILSLACSQMKMSAAEAISAATINGAWALRLQERKGSIEAGKDADLAIFNGTDYREIPYWISGGHLSSVILGGQQVSLSDR